MSDFNRQKENHERNLLISVANKRQKSRESLSVSELFPQDLVSEIQPIIEFLEAYYEWLSEEKKLVEDDALRDTKNSVKLKNLSTNLYSSRDIDEFWSSVYEDKDIEKLFFELASKFPQRETAIDYRTILKNIKTLYVQKGSENAVKSFFKIVFGSNSSIYYPWDDVLIASAGEWDGQRFLSNKGFLSDNIHLQDSNYWQRFSYDIKVDRHENEWRNIFEALLHPSGFKFFSSLFILLVSSNRRMLKTQLGILDSVISDYVNTFFLILYDENLANELKTKFFASLLFVFLVNETSDLINYRTFTRSTFFNNSLMEEFDTLVDFDTMYDINRRNFLSLGSIVESVTI
jgi:hypothetical protein